MRGILYWKDLSGSGSVEAICWTLVHSLWMGLVFAAFAGIFLDFTKRSRPFFRYNVLIGLFLLFVIGVFGIFLYELENFKGIARQVGPDVPKLTGSTTSIVSDSPHDSGSIVAFLTGFLSRQSALIVAFWILVLGLKSFYMLFGLGYTNYLRKRKAKPASLYWQDKLTGFCHDLGIEKTVTLLESQIVKIPVVFGHLKPVIFVPLGLLAQLPPGQLEAILLHELAHIRRNDYLVNLLQHIVETLFFFNPALLWLSSRIREERESCCDEIAIGHTNDRRQFVAALISFRELSMKAELCLGVAFPGTRNILLNRISRIVYRQNVTLDRMEKSSLLTGCLVAVLLTLIFARPAESYPQPVYNSRLTPILIKPTVAVKPAATQKPGADTPNKRKPSRNHQPGYEGTRAKGLIANLVTAGIVTNAVAVTEPVLAPVPSVRNQPMAGQSPETMVANLTNDLISAGIITDKGSLSSVKLTNSVLRVNDIIQDVTLQARLKAKYLDATNSDPHFGLHYYARTQSMGLGITIDKEDP